MTFILLVCANKHTFLRQQRKNPSPEHSVCVKPIKTPPLVPWDSGLLKWLLGNVSPLAEPETTNMSSNKIYWEKGFPSFHLGSIPWRYKLVEITKENTTSHTQFILYNLVFSFIESYKFKWGFLNKSFVNLPLAETTDSKTISSISFICSIKKNSVAYFPKT